MAVKSGESGFETEGPNRYYYSEGMPRDDMSAKDNKLFNKKMYDLMSNMMYSENTKDKKKVAEIQSFLESIKYLPDDSVDSLYGNMTQGARNRYIKNFEKHPDHNFMNTIFRYLKGS